MRLFKKLWNDESGALLSAEAAILGTVAVVGVGAGINGVATSVNKELKEVSYAIRSLDQSYCIPARKTCSGAWTAGSEFKQQPVEQSLKELREVEREAEHAVRNQAQRLQDSVEKQNNTEADKPKKPEEAVQEVEQL